MEVKIKRTYNGKSTVTYKMSYRKNKTFKMRDWIIKFRKDTYGWGFSEIVRKQVYVEPSYFGGGHFEPEKTKPIPRELILKMENIIRGLNS